MESCRVFLERFIMVDTTALVILIITIGIIFYYGYGFHQLTENE
jgi:hypothetical protein